MATGYFKEFKPEDVAQNAFVAYKQWTISPNGLDATVLADSGSVITGSEYYLATWSTSSKNDFVSGSSAEPVSFDGTATGISRYKFLIHANIDQMFYRYNSRGIENLQNAQPFQYIGRTTLEETSHRDLHRNAHVVTIPQAIYGEGIKPNSVNFWDGQTSVRLKDDGHSNLYDVSITTSSMVNNTNLVLHLPFSEGYKYINPVDRSFTLGSYYRQERGFNYNGPFPYAIAGNEVKFREGMHGYGLHLLGTSGSYVIADRQGNTKTEMGINDEFAISMWLKIPTSQSVTTSHIGRHTNMATWNIDGAGNTFKINKRSLQPHNDNVIITKRPETYHKKPFPFEISVGNDYHGASQFQRDGKIFFKRGDGVNEKVLSSSAQYNDNTWRHFLFQKTGSRLEMYCNGLRIAHGNDFNKNSDRTTISDAPVQIGGQRVPDTYKSIESITTDSRFDNVDGADIAPYINSTSPYMPIEYHGTGLVSYKTNIEPMAKPFTGSIDEIRIYNQAIPSASLAVLSSSITNTNKVGNIFYDYGILTITDPRPKYANMCSDIEKHYVNFQGMHTIYEEEYLCNIRSGDYELSMNPTLRINNSIKDEELKGMVSSSHFSPYITTVGLYNDNFDLIATAKMASPLKKPKNMDTTIVVRFDR